VRDKLVELGRWLEIHKASGEQVFSEVTVVSDQGAPAVRTVSAKMTMSSVSVTFEAKVGEAEGAQVVRITNPLKITYGIFGTVVRARGFDMVFKLVPYSGGVVVDATCFVKLEMYEAKASKATESLRPIFGWLRAG
jgi:hypothetical protein